MYMVCVHSVKIEHFWRFDVHCECHIVQKPGENSVNFILINPNISSNYFHEMYTKCKYKWMRHNRYERKSFMENVVYIYIRYTDRVFVYVYIYLFWTTFAKILSLLSLSFIHAQSLSLCPYIYIYVSVSLICWLTAEERKFFHSIVIKLKFLTVWKPYYGP